MIKVSIIIPVYNVAPYVEVCLRSVLEQDYLEKEIIIVDDCGTDNSMEIVQKVVVDYKQEVHILKHTKNKGLSAARNSGIKAATGDYLFFIDSDDYLLCNDAISRFVGLAMKWPDAEIVFGCVKGLFTNFEAVNRQNEYCNLRKEVKKTVLREWPFLAVWNRLIKRKWVLENRLFFKSGIVAEDMLWDFYAAKYMSAFAVCKIPTYWYRAVSTGLVQNTKNNKLWIDSYSFIIRDVLSHIDCCCILAQLYFMVVVTNTYNNIMRGNAINPNRFYRIMSVFLTIIKALFNRRIK